MKKKNSRFPTENKKFFTGEPISCHLRKGILNRTKMLHLAQCGPPPRPPGKWTCMTLVLFVGNCANIVIVGRRRLMLNGSKAGGQIDGAETYLSLRYVNIVSRVQTVYYAFSIMHCTSNKISNLGHMHGLTTEETLRPRNIVI
jgi:hypothetical protein